MAKAVVARCVADVTVPKEVENTEEGEGAVDEVRRLSTVLTYRIQLVILQSMNGPA